MNVAGDFEDLFGPPEPNVDRPKQSIMDMVIDGMFDISETEAVEKIKITGTVKAMSYF